MYFASVVAVWWWICFVNTVAQVRIPQDKETGKIRGIAFISFKKHSGVLHALTLDGDDLKGKDIKVRRADSKSENKGGPRPGAADGNRKAAGSRDSGRREENGAPGQNNGRGVVKDNLAAVEMAKAAIMRVAEASRAKTAVAESVVYEDSTVKRRKMGGEKEDSATGGEEPQRERRGRWGEEGRRVGDVRIIKEAETQNRKSGGYRYISRDGDDGVVGRYDSRSPEHREWDRRDGEKTRDGSGKIRRQGDYKSEGGSGRRERDDRGRRERRTEEGRGKRYDDRREDEARGRYDEDRRGMERMRDRDSRNAKRGGRPRYSHRSRSPSRDRW